MAFNTEALLNAGKTFLMLFGELFGLFIGISFVVALLQVYVSQERIKRILTTPRKGLNSILGALLGAVTPFCSCSTIPVLVGLFKSGAPFCGAISFLLTSPILNPAIITLMLAFFGVKATVIYAIFTFTFAVVMGLVLDKAGFEKEIKNVSVKGGHQDGICWEKLQGTFWQKQWMAVKVSLKEAFTLFRSVVLFLLLGAGIGAFVYEFVPTDPLANFAGASKSVGGPSCGSGRHSHVYPDRNHDTGCKHPDFKRRGAWGYDCADIRRRRGKHTGSIPAGVHFQKEDGDCICPLYFCGCGNYGLCI